VKEGLVECLETEAYRENEQDSTAVRDRQVYREELLVLLLVLQWRRKKSEAEELQVPIVKQRRSCR
jgi:hypothetical protein